MVAASAFAGLLPLLIVLACPLMMIFMMRGMHGHGSDGAGREEQALRTRTLEELKHERDLLNEEIGSRVEQGEGRTAAWR
jgi:hypothetical protein